MTMFFMAMAIPEGFAQEVTINLFPGWTWISYPNAETMGIAAAFGDFTPMQGDIVRSKDGGQAVYNNGVWVGSLKHLIPGQGYHYYSARTEYVEFVFAKPASDVVATTPPTYITAVSAVAGGTVNMPEGSHVFLCGVCWDTEPTPTVDNSHTVEESGIGQFTSILNNLIPNTTYYLRAYLVSDNGLVYGDELNFNTLDGGCNNHDYVDLGLPSGTLWATCNVGASSPEEYGDYFAWGETLPKDGYYWSNYLYCNGSYSTLTKYCNDAVYGYNGFADNLTTLLSEDDAATANWGEGWRMPTHEEFEELYNNTTCTFATQNGVFGSLFTASNGNSIFLPAAGSDSYQYEIICWYRSSSLNTINANKAWLFVANFNGSEWIYGTNAQERSIGFPVRAVRNNTPTGAINGKFTINDNGEQVYFSQGNLQYIGSASTPYWKFAENQWDFLGVITGQNSPSCCVDRDLFGWGTSGWDNRNVYYQPYDTDWTDYYGYDWGFEYGPPVDGDLTGTYSNSDWGVYNAISNGGNAPGLWRTLLYQEWRYVFNIRNTQSGIRYAKAMVNGVNGIVLLPDNWNASSYPLNEPNASSVSYTVNEITIEAWSFMEANGAVFLPAAGTRDTWWVSDAGFNGGYWSASENDSDYAYGVHFSDSDLNPAYQYYYRFKGLSVRLVKDVE